MEVYSPLFNLLPKYKAPTPHHPIPTPSLTPWLSELHHLISLWKPSFMICMCLFQGEHNDWHSPGLCGCHPHPAGLHWPGLAEGADNSRRGSGVAGRGTRPTRGSCSRSGYNDPIFLCLIFWNMICLDCKSIRLKRLCYWGSFTVIKLDILLRF